MVMGVRSYGNTLVLQNIFIVDNLPDKVPALKNFARKILRPNLRCTEAECGTQVGRVVQVPEGDLVGLINLEDNSVISDQDITDWINEDVFFARVRDTSTCVTRGGFCRNCGTGYYARIDEVNSPSIGETLEFPEYPRAFQNYIANTYSGAMVGWQPLSSEPLPIIPDNWSYITNHSEMDAMCNLLRPLGISREDYTYINSVEDILERALLIICLYGVYGNA